MIGSLGGMELLLILVLALIVFGPKKLPEIGKSLGKVMTEFRRASSDFKRTIEDEVEASKLKESLDAAQLDAPALPPPAAEAAPEGTVPVGEDAGVSPPYSPPEPPTPPDPEPARAAAEPEDAAKQAGTP